MKRIITASVCLLLLISAVTCGHKNERESWVARYNGPGNGTDAARFIAVDNSGNVYITGVSEGLGNTFDYATIKYNSLGKQLWIARYDAEGSEDKVYSMAVDNSGNVYVTGQTGYRLPDSSWNCDYATVKYDSSGNQLWAASYNGPGNYWDGARSLAVDNSGNVYITGFSEGLDSTFDYATIKYDSRGNELWVARYNGPGNGWDRASSLALDNSGNVYVTGESRGSGINFDYATVKYDSSGNQLWAARYNGPGIISLDVANSLALDNSGNVYVTGCSQRFLSKNSDYATVKYDSLGNELWVARYNAPGNGWDRAYSIAVDNSGNVYVTGESTSSDSNSDYATIKYGPDGQ